MLWLGLNTQEPWISLNNTTRSREAVAKVNGRLGEGTEGGLQNELKLREETDINRARGKRDTDKESDGDRTVEDR